MMPLTSEEIKHLAEEAAKTAVRELLTAMGVNAHDPEALLEMQRDFAHVRNWRKSTDAIKGHGIKAAVTFVVTGALGYLVFLFHK